MDYDNEWLKFKIAHKRADIDYAEQFIKNRNDSLPFKNTQELIQRDRERSMMEDFKAHLEREVLFLESILKKQS